MDWTEYDGKQCCVILDDSSRKILAGIECDNATAEQSIKGSSRKCWMNAGTSAESERSSQTMELNSGLADEFLKDRPKTVLKRSYKNRTSSIFCAESNTHKATAK